ncbi:MAG: DNA polymerase III subunit beta [Candidatus Pacebacteria bacterium]|nr:DNA polymerase III subunit beta [Candidatus Paceibacterota bacterium]MBP9839379.1 DNA polymerase III subunit beta [Candidatus Paceibacterota bacterium]MDQ5922841.1 polymerase subunit beta [Patescibacteria group bacterium]
MKLECDIEKIKNSVSKVERITGKNLTLPVLSSILLVASGKSLKLRSTNLSLGVEIEIPVKIEKEGVLAVSGNILSNVLSNISEKEKISLEDKDGNLLLKTKKNQLRIKGNTYEDFPTIPQVSGNSFEIEGKKLIEGIKSVYYSAAIGDIKPEISSVFMYGDGEYLVFVATDSFRLAEKKIKIKGIEEFSGILIPFKNIPEIIRVLGETTEIVKVSFNKNQVSFAFDGVYLTSRVIDGLFPDYRQIIPKEYKTEVVTLKQDLLNALKISNIFSDKFNQINIKVLPKDKVFEISSENNDIGDNKTYLDGALQGEDVELSFNYRYFLDCFQSLNKDSVSIKFNQSSKPMVVKSNPDELFTYLIMPMNK